MAPFPMADSESRAYRNVSPGLRFFLAVLASFTLMFLDHRGSYLEQARTWLGAAMYPLQVALDSPSAAWHWMGENLVLRDRLIAENEALRRQALADSANLQRLDTLRAENARIRALLDSRSRVPDRVVVGEILAVDMDPLRHRIVLNRGSKDGAYKGQALIDAHGVVGQITRDHLISSEAILITDPDHALPVEIVRNGLRTIAVGTGDFQHLSLPYLARNADIKAGDQLITSGLGGAFPAGYPVGTVDQVDKSAGAFLAVTARPAAALDRLREVLLVFQPAATVSEAAPVTAPATTTPATTPAAKPATKPATVPASTPTAPPAAASTATPAATPAVAPATTPMATPDTTPGTMLGTAPGAIPDAAPAAAPAATPAMTPAAPPETASPPPGEPDE
ncbi:MAG: rod shape-determining protein MreC [Gammaproteobacteria bacterium PRO9]|nr:rod shape-determining protein MreC [Gammaproteobacteria bacterium PRO9]